MGASNTKPLPSPRTRTEHFNLVEQYGLSSITSGLSIEDTENIWNNYHNSNGNNTDYIDFNEWKFLAKDIIHAAMADLEAKNIIQLKNILALRRLHPLDSELEPSKRPTSSLGYRSSTCIMVGPNGLPLPSSRGGSPRENLSNLQVTEKEKEGKSDGLLPFDKMHVNFEQARASILSKSNIRRGSLQNPRASISPIPIIPEDQNPFDDIPEDDPELKTLIPQLKHSLENFEAELNSEECLKRFFNLVDIDCDEKIKKPEFVIAFSYIGFSFTRNKNTGHIEGFILDKMFEAASEGNVQKITFLNQLVEANSQEMGACLYQAVKNGQFEVCQYLIDNAADINYQDDKTFKTAFHLAAQRDNVALLELLLTADNPNINTKDKFGNTPLHDACEKVACEASRWLLNNGAFVNEMNVVRLTPLAVLQVHEEKLANLGGNRNGLRRQFQIELRDLLLENGAKIIENPRRNSALII